MLKKISDLLGKPILSIFDGQLEGFVKSVYFNKKFEKLCWIEFFDDSTQEEKIINAKNIYHVGNDALTIKNNDDIYLENLVFNDCINPINLDLYSVDGNKIGKIVDITINEKFLVENIVLTESKIISQKNILNAGKNVVLYKDENENIKVSNFKNKVKITSRKTTNKVKIMQTKTKPLPTKIVTKNYDFLIGKKIDKNIYADNNELIIKKHTKVTRMIIDIACKKGKLKELTASAT